MGNEKLRVAHIITQLELGGAQQNTLYTLGHLDAERYEPLLICGTGGMLDAEAAKGSWPVYFVKPLVRSVNPIFDLWALVSLYRQLVRLKPHIVHTHSSKAGILGRIAAYIAGVPVIIHTFHGFGFNRQQRPWTRWLFIQLEKFCAMLSTELIFVSESNIAEADMRRIGPRTRKNLIRSGIYIGEERRKNAPAVRQTFNIPAEAWVVVSVGNFKPQKNPWGLAHVAGEVLKHKLDTHFLFIGDGELRKDVEAWCAEEGWSEQIHFLGWCSRQINFDVKDVLLESNCFLLTSLWEGLPRSLLEAFGAGLPAVAFSVDGVRDVLKDEENGFLIPEKDIPLAAKKILWLADHPEEARRMGENGRRHIQGNEKQFSIDEMVRQQEALYDKLYEAVPLKDYYKPRWTPTNIS